MASFPPIKLCDDDGGGGGVAAMLVYTEQTAKVMAKIPPNWMMVSQIQTLPSSGLSE